MYYFYYIIAYVSLSEYKTVTATDIKWVKYDNQNHVTVVSEDFAMLFYVLYECTCFSFMLNYYPIQPVTFMYSIGYS